MGTHLNFTFKGALYFSTLAINLFNSGTMLFSAAIANATLQTSLCLNALPPTRHAHL